MLKRLLTGFTVIGTVIAAILLAYFVSPIFLDIYILIWIAVAVYEMSKSLNESGYKIYKIPLFIMLLVCYPIIYTTQHFLDAGAISLMLLFLFIFMLQCGYYTFGKKEVDTLKNLGINILVLIYPLLLIAMTFISTYKYGGIFFLLLTAFLPVGIDSCAYLVGKGIGRKKLCPSISPKKTVAGAVGGLIGGMIVSICFYLFFELYNVLPDLNYRPFISHNIDGWEWKTALIYLTIGCIGGVVCQIGDLFASRIKRELNIKDYGKIFPGHGGVMDRLDSIIASIIVVSIALLCVYGF